METYACSKSRYNMILEETDGIYLYNTFTGSLQPLSEEAWEYYSSREQYLPEENTFLFKTLSEMGAILPENMDERQFLQEIAYAGNDTESINALAMWLMTTEKCNYNCFYCYEDREKAGNISYSDEDWLGFLDRFPALNRLSITWYGGEPLMNFHRLDALAEKTITYCRQRGIFYDHSIITNAVLLTPEITDRLQELNISRAQITLDGPQKYHEEYKAGQGTFAKVLDNLYYAAQYLHISVRINIDKNNAEAVPELLDILAARGLHNIWCYFSPIHTVGNCNNTGTWDNACYSTEEFAAVEAKLLKHMYSNGQQPMPGGGAGIQHCGVSANNYYIVGVDGKLAKCPNLLASDPAGTLASGLDPCIFDHPWLKKNVRMPSECLDCILLPSCRGGCPYRHQNSYESCSTKRYNIESMIRSTLEADPERKSQLFRKCSTLEKMQELEKQAEGTTVNRNDLKKAAIDGGGLGMLLAGLGK